MCIQDTSLGRIGWSTFKLLLTLWRNKVDLYFDLEVYSAYAALLALMSLAVDRVGFGRYSATFKRSIYTHLYYFNTRVSVLDLYLQLAVTAGLVSTQLTQRSMVYPKIGQEVLEQAMQKLKIDGSRPVILLNPNASDLLLERCWPLARFAKVASLLAQRDVTVVLLGGKHEAIVGRTLLAMMPPELQGRVVNSAGQLSLLELMALIRSATLMVTNDTGPFHMAVAAGTPVVAMFGPLDPRRLAFPAKVPLRVLYHPVACSPCVHEIDIPPCHGYNVCMQAISSEQVLLAIDDILDNDGTSTHNTHDSHRTIQLPQLTDAHQQPLGKVIASSIMTPTQPVCPACADTRQDQWSGQYHRITFRCKGCGLLRLDPMPGQDEIQRQMALASLYWQDNPDGDTRALGMAMDGLKQGQRVLYGDMRHKAPWPMLAKSKAHGCVAPADYFEFPATTSSQDSRITLLDKSIGMETSDDLGMFDLIFLDDCLDTKQDPAAVLLRLAAQLKPQGRMVITFQKQPGLWTKRHAVRFDQMPEQLGRLFGITSQSLDAWLAQAGLRSVRTQAVPRSLVRHDQRGEVERIDGWMVTCSHATIQEN